MLRSDCPKAKLSGFTVDGTFAQYTVCQLLGIVNVSLTSLGFLRTSCNPYSTKSRQQRRGLDTLCGKVMAF